MSEINMFKSAKVKRLEKELEEENLHSQMLNRKIQEILKDNRTFFKINSDLKKEVAELKDDREQQFKLLMERMATSKRLADRNLKLHDEVLVLNQKLKNLQEIRSETCKDLADTTLAFISLKNQLADMTEARGAVAAGAKFLRGKLDDTEKRVEFYQGIVETYHKMINDCLKQRDEYANKVDMQDAVLKLVATHGEKHPECVARIAKAVVEG